MGENLIVNKKDWSREIQPTIDLISILDNDATGISAEDINLARSRYCQAPSTVDMISPLYDNATGISADDINLARPQYCQAPQNMGPENRVLEILCEPSAKSVQATAQKLFGMRSVISDDNPIRKLLTIESKAVFGPETRRKLLDFINKEILPSLEKFLLLVKDRLQPGMSPQGRVNLVYKDMQEQGYTLRQECVSGLFIMDVSSYSLDCDTSSFLFAMVAHEFNWPVYLVQIPNHVFIRWDDGTVKFNIDYINGGIREDSFYREAAGISNVDERKFKFSDAEFLFYLNRGTNRSALSSKSMQRGAINDFDMAERLKPPFEIAEIYSNRGTIKVTLGQFDSGMKDLDRALKIDPNNATAFNSKGIVMAEQGKYEEAIKYFEAAIKINPNYVNALYNEGGCYEKLGKRGDAATFYKRAFIANPNDRLAREAFKRVYRDNIGCN